MELQTVVQEFLLAGQANGWSPATRRQYERHLAWLLAWLAEHGAVALSEVTRSLLREWLAAQRERWAPATCRVAVIALRSLLAFATSCCARAPAALRSRLRRTTSRRSGPSTSTRASTNAPPPLWRSGSAR